VRIACVGDACVDRYAGPAARRSVGGNAVNVAAALARAGHDVAWAGAVGDDEDGRAVLAALAALGVDTSLAAVVPGGVTGACEVELGPDGERAFRWERVGVSADYRPDAAALTVLAGCAWVHAAGLLGCPELPARLAGVRVSFDFSHHDRPALVPQIAPHVELAVFSRGGGREAALAIAREAVALGATAAIVTRGAHGSLVFDGALHERPAHPARVVDSLGAGDALIAAVIDARLRGAGWPPALEAGSRAAAAACAVVGAWEP